MVGQYPPVLVARAVETGLWSVEWAISLAAKIVEPQAQAEICTQLLALDGLQPDQKRKLGQLGLAIALPSNIVEFRAQIVTGLAPYLTIDLLAEALQAA